MFWNMHLLKLRGRRMVDILSDRARDQRVDNLATPRATIVRLRCARLALAHATPPSGSPADALQPLSQDPIDLPREPPSERSMYDRLAASRDLYPALPHELPHHDAYTLRVERAPLGRRSHTTVVDATSTCRRCPR